MLVDYVAELGLDPHSRDGLLLLEECVLCLAGVNSAFAFQHNVKSIDTGPSGLSGKLIRLKLQEHSYRMLNVKYAALYLSLLPNKPESYEKLRPMLAAPDVDLFKHLFARRKFKSAVKARAKYLKVGINDVCPKAMHRDHKRFDAYYPKIMTHINARVGAKLRFLMRAENMVRQDLSRDLMCKTLRSYYSLLPTKQPEAYILNYLRRSASNETTNIIEKYTTDKRRRMIDVGDDGFGGREYDVICRSENQTGVGETEGMTEFAMLMEDVVDPTTQHLDSSILIHRLFKRFTGRKLKALQILAGGVDDGFNRYLRKNNRLKHGQDHTLFQARVSHVSFLETLAHYLGVYIEPFMKFVQSIGRMLTAHEEFA